MKMTAPLVRYCKDHTILLYEAKDDTTGVSFEKNGVKKWVPIVVTNYGKELGVKEMERCKKIVYFQNENGPQFSIRKGNVSSQHQLLDELIHS